MRLRLILRALKANKGKKWPANSQMQEYETFTMRVADFEGWRPEMELIWQGLGKENSERVAEDSALINWLRCWLAKPGTTNVGRKVRSGEIYSGLESMYDQKFTKFCRNATVLGVKIAENESALKILGYAKGRTDGCRTHTFSPSAEEISHCDATYKDSPTLLKWAATIVTGTEEAE